MTVLSVSRTTEHTIMVVDTAGHAAQLILDNPGSTSLSLPTGTWEVRVPHTLKPPSYYQALIHFCYKPYKTYKIFE